MILDSFLFDPFLLIGLAIISVYVSVRHLSRIVDPPTIFIFGFKWLWVGIFWVCSISLYYNLEWIDWLWKMLNPIWGLFGKVAAVSGRDFMINSGFWHFNHVDPPMKTHLIAGFLFALYPLWFNVGKRIGYDLFGMSGKQRGVVELL